MTQAWVAVNVQHRHWLICHSQLPWLKHALMKSFQRHLLNMFLQSMQILSNLLFMLFECGEKGRGFMTYNDHRPHLSCMFSSCQASECSEWLPSIMLNVPIIPVLCWCTGWQRGLVVRTSVLGWRTLTDLCLILWLKWVKCPLWVNQPGHLSLPSLRGW